MCCNTTLALATQCDTTARRKVGRWARAAGRTAWQASRPSLAIMKMADRYLCFYYIGITRKSHGMMTSSLLPCYCTFGVDGEACTNQAHVWLYSCLCSWLRPSTSHTHHRLPRRQHCSWLRPLLLPVLSAQRTAHTVHWNEETLPAPGATRLAPAA